MRAAIYCRKSTAHEGVHEEAKSVTRQLDHAQAYAESKGWPVVATFTDDGISGALDESKRAGLKALFAALPAKTFEVLIVASTDRLARDQWIFSAILAKLAKADVRLHCYQEHREVDLSGSVGKFMESIRSFGAEFFRESQTHHMVDALQRRAKAGYVHGGRCFGYTNTRVDGHVERRINAAEAEAVRQVFAQYVEGQTPKQIAAALNAAQIPAPGTAGGWVRDQQWTKWTCREILKREAYRGVCLSRWGEEVIRVENPALRIVSDEVWTAAQARLAEQKQIYLRATGGRLWGRPSNGIESRYLLSGLLACGLCGSGLSVVSRNHGRKRAYFYQCTRNIHARRRKEPCSNSLLAPLTLTDQVILTKMEATMLEPSVVLDAIKETLRRLSTDDARGEQRSRLQGELRQLDAELMNLQTALARGGELATIVSGIRDRRDARQRWPRS